MVTTTRRKRFRPRSKAEGAFHHGDLREALLEAATDAVEKRGQDALSLRPLAERLGVSQPAVYRHFASRDALLAEIAQRSWLRLEQALESSLRGHARPLAAVRASGRAYVRWAHEHPHLFRLLSSRVASEHRSAPLPPFPREHYYQGLGGAVPLDDPRLLDAFRAAWALSHGLGTFVVERVFMLVDDDEQSLAAADAAIDCFAEMLAARWPDSAL